MKHLGILINDCASDKSEGVLRVCRLLLWCSDLQPFYLSIWEFPFGKCICEASSLIVPAYFQDSRFEVQGLFFKPRETSDKCNIRDTSDSMATLDEGLRTGRPLKSRVSGVKAGKLLTFKNNRLNLRTRFVVRSRRSNREREPPDGRRGRENSGWNVYENVFP